MDPVHDRRSMDPVLGPSPWRGSIDQGSMFSTFPAAYIVRGLKSYIFSFLYLFALFVIAIFCCRGKIQAKSGIDGKIC